MDSLLRQQEIDRNLSKAVLHYRERGEAYAVTERDYRVALAKKMLELKTQGMSVTLIHDLSRGDEEVSNKKLQRDIALSALESLKEAINVMKLQLRILREEITEDRRG